MSRIRSKGTKQEKEFKRMYPTAIVHPDWLPYHPDFLMAGQVIFLDSKFWHCHISRERYEKLSQFWQDKLFRNLVRDCIASSFYEGMGIRLLPTDRKKENLDTGVPTTEEHEVSVQVSGKKLYEEAVAKIRDRQLGVIPISTRVDFKVEKSYPNTTLEPYLLVTMTFSLLQGWTPIRADRARQRLMESCVQFIQESGRVDLKAEMVDEVVGSEYVVIRALVGTERLNKDGDHSISKEELGCAQETLTSLNGP